MNLSAIEANHTVSTLPRVNKPMGQLTHMGETCRRRAHLEAERRHCNNTSEDVQNLQIVTTEREKLASMLDPRTVGTLSLAERASGCVQCPGKPKYR
jgi:hypothetical protein